MNLGDANLDAALYKFCGGQVVIYNLEQRGRLA